MTETISQGLTRPSPTEEGGDNSESAELSKVITKNEQVDGNFSCIQTFVLETQVNNYN